MQPARSISTTSPLTGGGDLSADRTFAIPAATAGVNGYATSVQITKLDGIAVGATANQSDAFLLARANHTGTQAWSTLTSTPTTLAGYGIADGITAALAASTYETIANVALKAPLASPTFTGTPAGPTAAPGTNTTQIASTAFVEAARVILAAATALKADIASPTFTGTVGGITASMVGLGSVDNTSDANKPVSTAQQTALNLKADLAGPTFTGTVGGITASMVGLGNVTNTSDANKPVSTAQQTALDLKANIASPALTGVPTAPTAAPGNNSTQLATTAYADAAGSGSGLTQPQVMARTLGC